MSSTTTMNQQGFLGMIRWSEVLSQRPDVDPYTCCFGFKHVILDTSDHPTLSLDQWPGEDLEPYLGISYRGVKSTAAGAYQIRVHTWRSCKALYGAKDFSPDEQDRIALKLIGEKEKALDDIENGDIQSAIVRCSGLWASLPASSAGQPVHTFAALIEQYNRAKVA